MWVLLAAVVICFTIIVMFRMYMDLRRQDQQHSRMLQSDRRDYERYTAVLEKENPKPALPDFTAARRATEMTYREHLLQVRQRALPEARYWEPGDTPSVVRYAPESVLSAEQLIALKRTYERNDYDRFMNQQRRTL